MLLSALSNGLVEQRLGLVGMIAYVHANTPGAYLDEVLAAQSALASGVEVSIHRKGGLAGVGIQIEREYEACVKKSSQTDFSFA